MRAVLKIILLVIWLLLMIVIITPAWVLHLEPVRCWLTKLTFKGLNALFGIKVKRIGELSKMRPLILVCNHTSYADILVLGSQLPIAFTPKKEIASWPVIGYCCRLAGCVFVERKPSAVAATKHEIAKRLGMGRVMCIFAEGTTNNGTQLLPFKSSFFGLAEEAGAHIQPAALRYTKCNGQPLNAQGRASIAWYGDMSLLPHLWKFLNFKSVEARLSLLELLEKPQEQDRKALCAASQAMIQQALEQTDE